ncbi:hypothetical protein LIER_16682 [Lithospermum erythrorhizon]|uniref:DUF4283 domain-containing protein n=1 Tax=Lithospermum erythrorhizon TaxID=34254 RepID=A0AAV3Q965_LITER
MQVEQIEFNFLPCWAQIWNLPLGYVDVDFGMAIGAHIGEVLEVDSRSIKQEKGRMLGHKHYSCEKKFMGESNRLSRPNKYDSCILVHGERRQFARRRESKKGPFYNQTDNRDTFGARERSREDPSDELGLGREVELPRYTSRGETGGSGRGGTNPEGSRPGNHLDDLGEQRNAGQLSMGGAQEVVKTVHVHTLEGGVVGAQFGEELGGKSELDVMELNSQACPVGETRINSRHGSKSSIVVVEDNNRGTQGEGRDHELTDSLGGKNFTVQRHKEEAVEIEGIFKCLKMQGIETPS